MGTEYTHTREFAGATFRDADMSGITIRDCYVADLKIVSAVVDNMRVYRHDAQGSVIIDDVDVTEFVAAELDRRHPERVRWRALSTVANYQELWALVEGLWAETLSRAERLGDANLHENVDGEYSVVDTLRHLVFAIDGWFLRLLRGEDMPFHPLGFPYSDYPEDRLGELGLDAGADPSYGQVRAIFDDRIARFGAAIESLTAAELAEERSGNAMPVYDPETMTVAFIIGVVIKELIEHRRYVERDLHILEAQQHDR